MEFVIFEHKDKVHPLIHTYESKLGWQSSITEMAVQVNAVAYYELHQVIILTH